MDSTTGELLSVMDGRYITEARTAAVSAVSARLLAREDAGVLAILGSGVQARSHLRAFSHVRALRDVRVWSPSEANRRAFAEEMHREIAAPIAPVASVQDAVDGADLVVVATAAREPVLQSEWVADGAHIAAVGACRPDQREMDTALVKRARSFVDSRTGALAEAGDLVLPMREGAIDASHIAGELGQLAAGTVAGRRVARRSHVLQVAGNGGRGRRGRAPRLSARDRARARARHSLVARQPVGYNRFLFFFFASSQRFFIISEIRLRPSADMCPRRRRRAAGGSAERRHRCRDAALAATPTRRAQLRGLLVEHRQSLARFDDLALQPAKCPPNPLRRLEQDAV